MQVRPCLVGEFLTPTRDQCLVCRAGTINMDPSAFSCRSCPDNAECSQLPGTYLGQRTATLIIPLDGFWHSNPFSEQVGE